MIDNDLYKIMSPKFNGGVLLLDFWYIWLESWLNCTVFDLPINSARKGVNSSNRK